MAVRTRALRLILLLGVLAGGCVARGGPVTPPPATMLATSPPAVTPSPPLAVPPPTPTIRPSPTPRAFGEPSLIRQGTDATEHLAPDGYPWARLRPLLVDKYGQLFVWAQKARAAGDGPVRPVVSSDGVRWTEPARDAYGDPEGEVGSFGSPVVAYDPVHDIVHSLWSTGSNPSDGGIVYRRYMLQRGADHTVTRVSRVASLILDNSGSDYGTDAQSLLWLNDAAYGRYGALLAVWSVTNMKGSPNMTELRSTMVPLGDTPTTADLASKWIPSVAADSTTISASPAVAYSRIEASTGGNIFPVVYRKLAGANAKDVYIVYPEWAPTGYTVKLQRMRWSAETNNWARGVTAPTPITPVVRAGSDAGYSAKYQLLSQIAEDAADDLLAVAFSTWKDDTAGDTWSFATIDPKRGDAVSRVVDAYVAGSLRSSADAFVAGDIMWDRVTTLFVVTYGDLPRKDGYAAAYDARGTMVVEPLRFHDASPVDIPTLGSTRFGDKIAILYRDYNPSARDQPPTYDPTKGYHGWFCTIELASPPA
jgi:hypothetical protein